MTPSSELHELIHSLTKAEKRYVTLSMRKRADGDDPILLKVFEAVAKQKHYDEKSIIDKFDEDAFSGNFASYKNHLVGTILRALVVFNDTGSKTSQLLNLVSQAVLLYEHTLYSLCFKIVNKTYKLAEELEDYIILQRVLSIERSIVVIRRTVHFTGEDRLSAIARINQSVEEAVEKQREIFEIDAIQVSLHEAHVQYATVFSSEQQAVEWAKQKIQNLSKYDYDALQSIKARCAWLHSHVVYYAQFVYGYAEALKYSMRYTDLFESNIPYLQAHGLQYMRSLSTMSIVAIWDYEFDIAFKTVHKLRHAPELYGFKRNESHNRFDLESYIHECVLYTLTLNFSNLDTFIDAADDVLERYRKHAKLSQEFQLLFSVAELLFLAGRYEESLEWTIRTLSDKNRFVSDGDSIARCLLCVCYLQIGNYKTAQSTATTALRAIKRIAMPSESLVEFFTFVRKYASSTSESHQQRLLQEYVSSIDAAAEGMSVERKYQFLQGNDIIWARHVLTGRPIVDIHRELTMQAQAAKRPD